MHLPHYPAQVAEDGFAYEFYSIGPKGRIRKGVLFTPTDEPDVYNLAMGDLNEDGTDLDDTVRTDNGDRDLVLSTVAWIVFDFCIKYPQLAVTATGSTEERKRLYRIGIANNLEMLSSRFHIFGLRGNEWESFQKSVAYEAFLVILKTNFSI